MINTVLYTAGQLDVSKIVNCNILLAEDCKLNAKLLTILFEQNGISIQVAKNGSEAIEKMQLNNFDIVLMDLEMPVMNGYATTAIIRHQLSNPIPIIAMTAHARPFEREKCLLAGMNAYISKPADENVLFSTIYNLVYNSACTVANRTTATATATITVTEKICNLSYLITSTRGNKIMLNNIIKIFMQQIPEELAALAEAIEKTKYTNISDIAHKLKSSIAVLGIAVLKPLLDEMEQLGNIALGIEKIKQLNDG
ncbi:MAG: response regulator, partial [Ferruginibacter sp.]